MQVSSLSNVKLKSRTIQTLGIALLFAVIIFLFRGWLRGTLLPNLTGAVVSHHLATVERGQLAQVQVTLPSLSQRTRNHNGCDLDGASGLTSVIYCFATSEQDVSSTHTTLTLADLADVSVNLKQRGWTSSVNDTSITVPPNDSLNFSYERSVDNNVTCHLNYSAYRADAQAASYKLSDLLLSCYRYISIF